MHVNEFKKKRLRIILSILYYLLISHHLFAVGRLKFDRLSIEEGLSQSIVDRVLQDSRGYMWFCTEDGLNQFDGYHFTVMRNDPNDSNSLSQNYTLCIAEDRTGNLWIGTFHGGLDRYNPQTGEFRHFRADPQNPDSLCHDVVRDIYQDSDGLIWIGTDGGLTCYDPVLDKMTCYSHNPHQPRTLCNNRVRSICESNTMLWIGTDSGLSRFDKKSNQFVNFFHNPANENSLCHDSVRKVYADRAGTIWIGTDGGGLDKLESNVDGLLHFTHYRASAQAAEGLSDNRVFSICEDAIGDLWIGTNGGGLYILDRDTDIFTHFKYDAQDAKSVSYDEIYDIYMDSGGVMWLGTYGGGISKANRLTEQFSLIQNNPNDSNSLNHNIVWSIYEDGQNNLWVGTHGGGLNCYNRINNTWTHYRNRPGNSNSLSHDIVRIIHADRLGFLWLGTNGGGLNQFDPRSGRFVVYRHDPDLPGTLSHDEIRCIYEDRNGIFWIGTNGGGLNRFDRQSGKFASYVNRPDQSFSLSNNYVRVIHEDRDGMLWIGTQGGGLERFDPARERFTHYRSRTADSTALSNDNVFCIHQDASGMLWLGTYGGGLDKFDRRTGIFEHFTKQDGLGDNSIYSILEDESGHLWMSTNNGITMFDPGEKTFINYTTEDGLQSSEFNGGSAFKSKSGEMFFGGISGINSFFPENIKENEHIPPVVITAFYIFNQPVTLLQSNQKNTLRLSYRDYYFSFEFAALDYTAPSKNRYAYKMEGLDKDWIYTDASKRYAGYSTLPPGRYTFRVKASNNDGHWNETGAMLKIMITPPIWRTWWFRLLLTLMTAGIIYYVLKRRIATARMKQKSLVERVHERTDAAQKLQAALDEVERLKNRLQAENVYLKGEIKSVTNFENIITTSALFNKVLAKVEQVAATDATVLLSGESGTGKELIARAIHNLSERNHRILVKVNCAALPANLIESELFGHEKGAFTGALARKAGRFELADGGTLFLDEIGELPMELQVKLLRVLQEGEFERVGSSTTLKVNVRIIAATNRDLQKEIQSGAFRQDLYFRLNVFPIVLPPLRERPEDIPLLVNYFVKKYSQRMGKSIHSVSQHVLNELVRYSWPGNVRELENVIERAVITSRGSGLSLEDNYMTSAESAAQLEICTLEEIEKQHIIKILQKTNWRVSGDKGAALLLGLHPKTLESRMQKLGISRPV